MRTSAPAVATPAEPLPWPTPAQVWGGVALFGGTVFFLFANNTIVGLMLVMIKNDFGLSDTGVSWIVGFAGVLFAALAAVPVARLVDSRSRKLIIGVGWLIVGTGSLLCGLARGFWGLLLARLVGGVGGSGNGPAAYSILADYMPPEKLPRALAVMNIGFALSRPAALIFGGALIALVATMPEWHLPWIGTLHRWQIVFLCLGAPEVLLGVLALAMLHEPRRRGVPTTEIVPLRDIWRHVYAHRRAFGPIFIGLALLSLSFGSAQWAAAFFQRTYGWSPQQFGIIEGAFLFFLAPAGMLAGGFIAEWLAKKGYNDANLRVVFFGVLLLQPFAFAYPLMPTAPWAIAMSVMNTTIAGALGAPQNAALQVILPNRMRGIITALYLLVFTLIGIGLGPTLIGLITDYVFGDESKVRYSLVLLQLLVGPLAVLIFYLGMKPYGEEYARMRELQS